MDVVDERRQVVEHDPALLPLARHGVGPLPVEIFDGELGMLPVAGRARAGLILRKGGDGAVE